MKFEMTPRAGGARSLTRGKMGRPAPPEKGGQTEHGVRGRTLQTARNPGDLLQ